MKTITQKLIKGLLVIVLFTGVSVALSTAGVQTVSEAKAAGVGGGVAQGSAGNASQVSANTVYQYLVNRGYSVQSLSQICGSTNWRAYTTAANGTQYITTIYVQSSQVVASNDSAL